MLHVPVPTGEQWITLLEIPELTRLLTFYHFGADKNSQYSSRMFRIQNWSNMQKQHLLECDDYSLKISRGFWERVHRGFGRLLFSAFWKKSGRWKINFALAEKRRFWSDLGNGMSKWVKTFCQKAVHEIMTTATRATVRCHVRRQKRITSTTTDEFLFIAEDSCAENFRN